MDLKIISRSNKYEWKDIFYLVKWKSRDCTGEEPLSYRKDVSKKRILGEVAKLTDVPGEIGVIISYITELIGIIVYEEEKEIELVVGSLSNSYRVSFALENESVVQLLEGR